LSDRKRFQSFIAGTRYSEERQTNEPAAIKHHFELKKIISLVFTREKYCDSHLAIEEYRGDMLTLCDSACAMI